MDRNCPHCSKSMDWSFLRLKQMKSKNHELTAYLCPHCEKPFVTNKHPKEKQVEVLSLIVGGAGFIELTTLRNEIGLIIGALLVVLCAGYVMHFQSTHLKDWPRYKN